MSVNRLKFAAILLTAATCLAMAPAFSRANSTDSPGIQAADEIVLSQLDKIKTEHTAEVFGVWFPSYRAGAVAAAFTKASIAVGEIDTSGCDSRLRKHVKQTEAKLLVIAELIILSGDYRNPVVLERFAQLRESDRLIREQLIRDGTAAPTGPSPR